MTDLTPSVPHEPTRFSVREYFDLVEAGVLAEDDRVELLEGVIVSMTPSSPPHAFHVNRITKVLLRAIGEGATVRTQCCLILGDHSVPEPDVAVVPGPDEAYRDRHPTSALLVVEVSDSSLAQDRLSKARIYARAGIPEYWIVDLREGVLEVMRDPEPAAAIYRSARKLHRLESIEPTELPGVRVDLAEILAPAPA